MFELDPTKQNIIPGDLSQDRYISGMAALNLPAPEDTSGDWHFMNLFYSDDKPSEVFVAGVNGRVDTRHIYGCYGVYECSSALRRRGLRFDVSSAYYAANHTRAILDLIYYYLLRHLDLSHFRGASTDYLDTEKQEEELLRMASKMLTELDAQQKFYLEDWIAKETAGGVKYAV